MGPEDNRLPKSVGAQMMSPHTLDDEYGACPAACLSHFGPIYLVLCLHFSIPGPLWNKDITPGHYIMERDNFIFIFILQGLVVYLES